MDFPRIPDWECNTVLVTAGDTSGAPAVYFNAFYPDALPNLIVAVGTGIDGRLFLGSQYDDKVAVSAPAY